MPHLPATVDSAWDLTGLTALVTGASRGLGRSMALALAGAGSRVIVTGRDTAALADTVKILEQISTGALSYEVDIADSAAVSAFTDVLWNETGGIDILIANAGISLVRSAVETTTEAFAHVIDTNVLGTFTTVREIGSRMLQRGHGKVITITSDIGIRGSEGWVAYAASKAAVISMTKTLAWEWAPSVTVNSIAPGAFATDINSHLLADPDILGGLNAATPLGRVGQVDEIGPLAVFLAGAGSDFMTGQIISIDGGIQRS
jgi:NAD(P)-dependent dehydrogenase (short-subunit alcohol dehydrogenase family)